MKQRLGALVFCRLAVTMFAIAGFNTPSIADGLHRVQTQASPNCTCRYQGQDFQVGDRVCLNSPDGPQQAECGFVLNNTSWNFTGTSCVYSSISTPGQLAALPVMNVTPVPTSSLQ